MIDPVEAIVFYVVFVFSVTVHEAAHATAALFGGDPTAYEGGQVSLDPITHMQREPFGMVVLPLIGVVMSGWPLGWASAPFDPTWAERYPRRAAWMALAGPAANLALFVLMGVGVQIGLAMGAFEVPMRINFDQITTAAGDPNGVAAGLAFIMSVTFSMNLLLFVLNMIPIFPLDGGTALTLLLPESMLDAYYAVVRHPLIAIGGLILVFTQFRRIFRPILFAAIDFLYPGVSYS
ncbi:MAG: site-2 protease family protein [Myxococcota bacterium]